MTFAPSSRIASIRVRWVSKMVTSAPSAAAIRAALPPALSGTEDHHPASLRRRQAAEQQPFASFWSPQQMAARLHRDAAGDVTHRCQNRQTTTTRRGFRKQ